MRFTKKRKSAGRIKSTPIPILTGLACADDPVLRDAELKRLRFHLIHVAGRLSRSQCKMRLRFLASPETVQRILKVWVAFPLPTQATAFQ
jgi:hypothetical protein